jgi:hydrogenase maturation factor
VSVEKFTVLFDAQTPGGLLIAVKSDKTKQLISELLSNDVETAELVGRVVPEHPTKVIVQN